LEIAFNGTDTGERWLVVRHPKGFDWRYSSGGRAPKAEVTVNGTVEHLYLLACKRIPVDASEITVMGEQAVFHHWYRYSSV
jgi:hypothetical protein